MSRMEIHPGIDALPSGLRFAMAVGAFDGVHRGHQALVSQLVARAAAIEASPVLITFEPHPAAFLRGDLPRLLCSVAERDARLAELGVEHLVVQRFDAPFASLTAEAFLERLRVQRDLLAVVMTPGSAFGRGRSGTTEVVREIGDRRGFALIEVAALLADGVPISSTRIRDLVESGRLRDASRLLGRRPAVSGRVVRGDARGVALGFATANLAFEVPVCLPPDGIYAVGVTWGGPDPLRPARSAGGVASLGVRPTFGGGARWLEVHLLDLDEDLYDLDLRVTFVRRQRSERRFAGAQPLIVQMARDVERARSILGLATGGSTRVARSGDDW